MVVVIVAGSCGICGWWLWLLMLVDVVIMAGGCDYCGWWLWVLCLLVVVLWLMVLVVEACC